MPDTLATLAAESQRAAMARIEAAQQDRVLERAFAALERVNRSGWSVRAWDAHCDIFCNFGRPDYGWHLLVGGSDNFGDRFHGVIDAQGNLSGEPSDD